MARYISPTLVEERVSPSKVKQLCSDDGIPMSDNERLSYLNKVVLLAEANVDKYAGRIYKTPLPLRPEVQDWALNFAVYILYQRASGDNIPSMVKDNWVQTLKELEAFCKGEIAIPGALQLRNNEGLSMVIQSDCPVFTESRFFVPRVNPNGGMWDEGMWT